MFKVAIDTYPLKSGHRFRGVGIYTKNLTEALGKIDTGEVKIEPVELKKPDSALTPEPYSLIHYPYFEPFFLSLPLRKELPTIVTIHDLIPLVFPQHFPKGMRGWFKWQIQKWSLKGVKRVIADSQNSKKDIIKFTRIPAEKIRVIYLAADKEFKRLLPTSPLLTKVKKRYQLPARFVLYVGDLNWNKNVKGLVKAFYEVKSPASTLDTPHRRIPPRSVRDASPFVKTSGDKSAGRQNLKLLLVGKAFGDKSLKEFKAIKSLIKKLKLEKEIIMLGFVPTQDLVGIYNLATVYCQPSFYEGFGLPVLEAMASGCPVVCANTASLPEIGGKAAIYINPQDVAEIARRIEQVVFSTREESQELVRKSLKQANKFSWQKTAKETLKVYQEILEHEG